MHINHMNAYQNSMKHRLHSGITPAQFELDAQRLDEMVLQAQANAASRTASATQTKIRHAKIRQTLKIALSQFGQLVTPKKRSEI